MLNELHNQPLHLTAAHDRVRPQVNGRTLGRHEGMTMDDGADFRFSSYRERVLEHQLVGEILREMWLRQAYAVEVLRAEVDAAGYDVVLEHQSVVRHIQLKATRAGGKRASVGVNVKLCNKPNGCVIWFDFAPDTMRPTGPFYWLGGPPDTRLTESALGKKLGRHTKGDSTGHKAQRENIREVPKSAFDLVRDIRDLTTRLFNVAPSLP
jgi:hypothetical protein